MLRRRLQTRTIYRLALGLALLIGGFIGFVFRIWDNFGTVQPGQLYRSSQMTRSDLAGKIRSYQIKTVLNLRGSHPEEAWYSAERSTTLEAGATQVDINLSSCEWMSRAQARALLEVLETAERPLRVHCVQGADRSAMVSAFAELLRPGSTLVDAEAQFTMSHLYFGLGDGVVTRQHLERYETWLKTQSLDHSPDHFRRWLSSEYQPGDPSRDRWNYDPYPLVVRTKGADKLADRRLTHSR